MPRVSILPPTCCVSFGIGLRLRLKIGIGIGFWFFVAFLDALLMNVLYVVFTVDWELDFLRLQLASSGRKMKVSRTHSLTHSLAHSVRE